MDTRLLNSPKSRDEYIAPMKNSPNALLFSHAPMAKPAAAVKQKSVNNPIVIVMTSQHIPASTRINLR